MLKGHVFQKQYFGNQIFALFINTFLNGENGISADYANKMEITYIGSEVTVDSGAICIQGRFLEEDSTTTLDAGTEEKFCSLVLEIDLSKENTDTIFNQASYKILKGKNEYPILTQDNIIKNSTGMYQYELARFKTSLEGITEFKDMRTYVDFKSIYKVINNHIKEIDDGSIFSLKSHNYKLIITEDKEAGEEIEIPCKYKVGADVLDVYLNGERLIKSSDDIGTDGHYCEVGDSGSVSNKIKSTNDWSLENADILEIVVRGEWS